MLTITICISVMRKCSFNHIIICSGEASWNSEKTVCSILYFTLVKTGNQNCTTHTVGQVCPFYAVLCNAMISYVVIKQSNIKNTVLFISCRCGQVGLLKLMAEMYYLSKNIWNTHLKRHSQNVQYINSVYLSVCEKTYISHDLLA